MMKRQRPRAKKARINKAENSPTNKNPRYNPQIAVGWGRGASEYRPGVFTKRYLEGHGEACAADVFRALKDDLRRINKERVEIGDKPIRGGTYNSYAKYWFWFRLLGLIEPVDRREPAIYDFLKERQFYQLTAKGGAEEEAWQDPISVRHPELR